MPLPTDITLVYSLKTALVSCYSDTASEIIQSNNRNHKCERLCYCSYARYIMCRYQLSICLFLIFILYIYHIYVGIQSIPNIMWLYMWGLDSYLSKISQNRQRIFFLFNLYLSATTNIMCFLTNKICFFGRISPLNKDPKNTCNDIFVQLSHYLKV